MINNSGARDKERQSNKEGVVSKGEYLASRTFLRPKRFVEPRGVSCLIKSQNETTRVVVRLGKDDSIRLDKEEFVAEDGDGE